MLVNRTQVYLCFVRFQIARFGHQMLVDIVYRAVQSIYILYSNHQTLQYKCTTSYTFFQKLSEI